VLGYESEEKLVCIAMSVVVLRLLLFYTYDICNKRKTWTTVSTIILLFSWINYYTFSYINCAFIAWLLCQQIHN